MKHRLPWKNLVGLLLGPLLFIYLLQMPAPTGLNAEAQAVLAITAWIATWWISEAIPIPVTSLLPIILLPLTGAADLQSTTASYANPVIFLFLGGFVVALAMEEWNLHKRIALTIIAWVGMNQRTIVLGFMLATAFLSMWISNTATAMMMLPIGVAIVNQLASLESGRQHEQLQFGKALMLGIAYAASIGGLGTLIGTPANAIFVAIAKQLFQVEVSFADWILIGTPLMLVLLVCCWFYLVNVAFRLKEGLTNADQELKKQLKALGPISAEEKWITAIFVFTAFAWISRSFLLNQLLPALDDSIIAVAAAMLLFIVPARSLGYRQGLLSWDAARKLPWGILLLFGGGLAIAHGFKASGLADYIGAQMTLMEGLGLFLSLLIIITLINFLTEITSNTATATVMLPVLASLAVAIDVHPFGPMVAACIASSCAFMLPVATPPNAVVFSSGYIKMGDMVKAGLWINLLFILIITLYIYYLLPLLWHIDLLEFPAAFRK